MLPHTATGGRKYYQIFFYVSYLCMLPVVLSRLCGSLKSRCFSAQQKMPDKTKGKSNGLVNAHSQSLGCSDLQLLSSFPGTFEQNRGHSSRWRSYHEAKVSSLLYCPVLQVISHCMASSLTQNHNPCSQQ